MTKFLTQIFGNKSQRFVVAVTLLTLPLFITGCTKGNASLIVGSWDVVEFHDNGSVEEFPAGIMSFTFKSDNTGTYDLAEYDYPEYHQEEMHLTFSYKLNDNYMLSFTFDDEQVDYWPQGLVSVDDTLMVWRRNSDFASEEHITHLRKK